MTSGLPATKSIFEAGRRRKGQKEKKTCLPVKSALFKALFWKKHTKSTFVSLHPPQLDSMRRTDKCGFLARHTGAPSIDPVPRTKGENI